MADRPSLLKRLLNAAPTARSERLEDFLTEVLAFLCESDAQFRSELAELWGFDARASTVTRTQLRMSDCRFDLVLGGPLGTTESLVIECKVWSDFAVVAADPENEAEQPSPDGPDPTITQIGRYLDESRDRPVPPIIGSLTVLPHAFEPEPRDANRWAGNRTWAHIARLLVSRLNDGIGGRARYVAEDLVDILYEKGIVMTKIDSTVFKPNPGRPALANAIKDAVNRVAQSVGVHWQAGRLSASTYYLYQCLHHDGTECLGFAYSDTRGELALTIDPRWLERRGATPPEDYSVATGEFWDWPARKLHDVTKGLTEAEDYETQVAELADVLRGATELVESLAVQSS